jgi:signal transduction histidine kinase
MRTDGEPLEREQAAMSLADVDAIRRRVLNVVGHSLRTPVTTIAGMAGALVDAPDDETRAALVEGIARNAQRLENLLDGLLLAAGVTTALPVDEAVATSVRPILEESWRVVGGEGDLVVDGPDAAPLVRASTLRQIAEFVLDNAVKYGDGPTTVTVERTPDQVLIRVASTGHVLPTDDELEHAFELLYRGEHAVTAGPGMGLGLFVARQLARIEGGEVTLTRAGEGVVVTVALQA